MLVLFCYVFSTFFNFHFINNNTYGSYLISKQKSEGNPKTQHAVKHRKTNKNKKKKRTNKKKNEIRVINRQRKRPRELSLCKFEYFRFFTDHILQSFF